MKLAALLLSLVVLSQGYNVPPFEVRGGEAFRIATHQAWQLTPQWAKVYVLAASSVEQVEEVPGAVLESGTIRVTSRYWMRDPALYAGMLVHEGWHLYAYQNCLVAGGPAGEAAAIASQVAVLRSLGRGQYAKSLEKAIGKHGSQALYPTWGPKAPCTQDARAPSSP